MTGPAPAAATEAGVTQPIVTVVGIGADGWSGLTDAARDALHDAGVILGAPRHLDALPAGPTGRRVALPTPLLGRLAATVEELAPAGLCVLASGDPMFHGIGATLARLVGPERLRVLTHPSSVSLACARLGWPLADLPVVSLVNRPLTVLLPHLGDRRRLLVLGEHAASATDIARLLSDRGFGGSQLTILRRLGDPDRETIHRSTADEWTDPTPDALTIIAIDCRGPVGESRLPGLDDRRYESDGQLTKKEIRALTVCALAPRPGELLWDVGGGSGSIAIEWLRAEPTARAVIFERVEERRDMIRRNLIGLGVPGSPILGAAPESFGDVDTAPDAIFVGGGVSRAGMLDQCWRRLRPGGRLVANAVTLESEAVLVEWFRRIGGRLRRFEISRAEPLGGFTTWRPQLPVVQWTVDKDIADGDGTPR